jgi:hypothetical protein
MRPCLFFATAFILGAVLLEAPTRAETVSFTEPGRLGVLGAVTEDMWKVAKLESNSCSMEFRSRYSLQESRDMEGEVKANLWNKNSASCKSQCNVGRSISGSIGKDRNKVSTNNGRDWGKLDLCEIKLIVFE